MFKRKLAALSFHSHRNFKVDDELQFRNLIVWLEDQKIRHYKIEDREPLRKLNAASWPAELKKYAENLGCPVQPAERASLLDWLLGYAVRLEYGDNVEKFKKVSAGSNSDSKCKSLNPMDKLDFNAPDFKAGVVSLAQLFQIPPHQDHLVLLKAVTLLVKERLSTEEVERHQKEGIKQRHSIPLDEIDLGFDTNDYISQEAAKILRLLHIRELRNLQNSVNEAIVAVQCLTANPKTDTRLGKVGR